VILLDTSGLLAAIDASQRSHEAARHALERNEGPLVLSPFVLAELDYLLATRVGVAAELALLDEVGAGAYELASFDARDVAEARTLIDSYRDLALGLADASIAVLARRLDADVVLTLDERHFRALRGPGGRPFRLLPADG
jgi:predicted nucleic acid-binding protein